MWFRKGKKQNQKENQNQKQQEKVNEIKIDNIILDKNFELLPIINEKTRYLIDKENTYVFKVRPVFLNKIEIKKAIEKIFGVKVLKIRTANYKKKIRGKTRLPKVKPKFKKVYAKLSPEQKINIFE